MIKITAMSKTCTCKTTEKGLTKQNGIITKCCRQNTLPAKWPWVWPKLSQYGLLQKRPTGHRALSAFHSSELSGPWTSCYYNEQMKKKIYRNSDFCQVFIESVISVPLALWFISGIICLISQREGSLEDHTLHRDSLSYLFSQRRSSGDNN